MKSVPLMNDESSDATTSQLLVPATKGGDIRKTTALACSTASPNRPMGTWVIRRSSFSAVLRKSINRGVRIGPLGIISLIEHADTMMTYGHRELNRIPSRA
jgi:hypothetical protein